jgi:hypothetical protein
MAFGRRSELGGGDRNRDGAERGEKAALHGCSPWVVPKASCKDLWRCFPHRDAQGRPSRSPPSRSGEQISWSLSEFD